MGARRRAQAQRRPQVREQREKREERRDIGREMEEVKQTKNEHRKETRLT